MQPFALTQHCLALLTFGAMALIWKSSTALNATIRVLFVIMLIAGLLVLPGGSFVYPYACAGIFGVLITVWMKTDWLNVAIAAWLGCMMIAAVLVILKVFG